MSTRELPITIESFKSWLKDVRCTFEVQLAYDYSVFRVLTPDGEELIQIRMLTNDSEALPALRGITALLEENGGALMDLAGMLIVNRPRLVPLDVRAPFVIQRTDPRSGIETIDYWRDTKAFSWGPLSGCKHFDTLEEANSVADEKAQSNLSCAIQVLSLAKAKSL